jgi:hypothetical protein
MKSGFFIGAAAAASFFASGLLVRHYELPPYSWARDLKASIAAQPRPPLYLARMSLFASSTGEADIVMLGDSITQFGEWAELFPHARIMNRGIEGDTTEGILDRLDEVIARKPKLVLLMIGINDLLLGVDPDVIAGKVHSIVARLDAIGTRVVLQSTLPVQDNVRVNSRVQALNLLLRSLPGVAFVDLRPMLAPSGALLADYTVDGIHLKGSAYLIWRDIIGPIIGGIGNGLGPPSTSRPPHVSD